MITTEQAATAAGTIPTTVAPANRDRKIVKEGVFTIAGFYDEHTVSWSIYDDGFPSFAVSTLTKHVR